MTKLKLIHKITGQETTVTPHAYELWDEKTKGEWKHSLGSTSVGKTSVKTDETSKDKYEKAKANAERLIKEGSFDAAVQAYEKAKELNPKASGWLTKQINAINEMKNVDDDEKIKDQE